MLNYLLLNDYLLALHNLHFSGFLCAKMQMAAFNLTSSKFSGRYIRTPLCWDLPLPHPSHPALALHVCPTDSVLVVSILRNDYWSDPPVQASLAISTTFSSVCRVHTRLGRPRRPLHSGLFVWSVTSLSVYGQA